MAENKKDKELSPLKSLIPGAVGGALSTTLTAPLDRVKDTMTQLSTSSIKSRAAAAEAKAKGEEFASHILKAEQAEAAGKNLWTTTKYVAKGGPKAFYKGLTGSLIKMPIAMGLTFAAGDYIKKQLQKTSMKKSEKTEKAKKILTGLGMAAGAGLLGAGVGYQRAMKKVAPIINEHVIDKAMERAMAAKGFERRYITKM
jgi:hypothetical protein